MKLTFKEVAAADRKGMAPDGTPALETADIRKIMEAVFAPDTGSDQTGPPNSRTAAMPGSTCSPPTPRSRRPSKW